MFFIQVAIGLIFSGFNHLFTSCHALVKGVDLWQVPPGWLVFLNCSMTAGAVVYEIQKVGQPQRRLKSFFHFKRFSSLVSSSCSVATRQMIYLSNKT